MTDQLDHKAQDADNEDLLDVIDGGLEHVAASAPILSLDRRTLRDWWFGILSNYGKYTCCAIFLALPSDREAIKYLEEYGQELNLITGDNCLVVFMSDSWISGTSMNQKDKDVLADVKNKLQYPQFDLQSVIQEHVSKGYSLDVAQLFDVSFTEFPCLIVFKDIRSSEHIVISFKDLEVERIADLMRQVFSIVRNAVVQKQDILIAIESQLTKDKLVTAGLVIVSKIRSLIEKTYEILITAFVIANSSS